MGTSRDSFSNFRVANEPARNSHGLERQMFEKRAGATGSELDCIYFIYLRFIFPTEAVPSEAHPSVDIKPSIRNQCPLMDKVTPTEASLY